MGQSHRFELVLCMIGLVIVFLSLFMMSSIGSDRYYYTSTDYMEPAVMSSDTLKIDRYVTIDQIYAAPKNTYPPGDIIMFQGVLNWIEVNRAIEKSEDGTSIVTQYDNIDGQYPMEVTESNLLGKVIEINPPFWTYNSLFWGFIFLGGGFLLIISIGVIIKTHKLVS